MGTKNRKWKGPVGSPIRNVSRTSAVASAKADDSRGTLPDRLREATKPSMVQVAPGKYAPNRTQEPPEVSLCRWQTNGDGTFSPLPCTERLVRLDQNLVRLLGFPGQWCTLTRLARAGFIETIQIAPHFTLLNLDSWFNHLRRCAEDTEFWDAHRNNYKEYRKSIF